jgi:hypothetical protein
VQEGASDEAEPPGILSNANWARCLCPYVTTRTALVVERFAPSVDHVKLISHTRIRTPHRFSVFRTLEKLLGSSTVPPHTVTGELTATGRYRKRQLRAPGVFWNTPTNKAVRRAKRGTGCQLLRPSVTCER